MCLNACAVQLGFQLFQKCLSIVPNDLVQDTDKCIFKCHCGCPFALVLTHGLKFPCNDRLRGRCGTLCSGVRALFVPLDLTDRMRDWACKRFPGKGSLRNASLKKGVPTASELHTLAHWQRTAWCAWLCGCHIYTSKDCVACWPHYKTSGLCWMLPPAPLYTRHSKHQPVTIENRFNLKNELCFRIMLALVSSINFASCRFMYFMYRYINSLNWKNKLLTLSCLVLSSQINRHLIVWLFFRAL